MTCFRVYKQQIKVFTVFKPELTTSEAIQLVKQLVELSAQSVLNSLRGMHLRRHQPFLLQVQDLVFLFLFVPRRYTTAIHSRAVILRFMAQLISQHHVYRVFSVK